MGTTSITRVVPRANAPEVGTPKSAGYGIGPKSGGGMRRFVIAS